MKKILDKIASFIEISYAVKYMRFDQPTRDEDLVAMREMFEEKTN